MTTPTDQPQVLLTPGPLTTSPSVRAAMGRDWATRDEEFRRLTSHVRQTLLEFSGLGAEFTCVPVAGSGTTALEAALATLVTQSDKVLVVVNGAYGARLAELCQVLGLRHQRLPLSPLEPADPGVIAATLAADRTLTLVAIVQCETSSGLLNPVQAVADVAAGLGRTLIADAMSSFGALPSPRGPGVLAVVSSANKCLQGTPGMAFVLARAARLLAATGNARSLCLDLSGQLASLTATREWRFTAPTQVLAALSQALEELTLEGGVAARGARYQRNAGVIIERLTALGLAPLLAARARSFIIVSFLVPEEKWFNFQSFYDEVHARGFTLYPGKVAAASTFRVGCIGDVYPETMERAAGAIDQALRALHGRSGKINGGSEAEPRGSRLPVA